MQAKVENGLIPSVSYALNSLSFISLDSVGVVAAVAAGSVDGITRAVRLQLDSDTLLKTSGTVGLLKVPKQGKTLSWCR